MSLSAWEQRALSRIPGELTVSDAKLAFGSLYAEHSLALVQADRTRIALLAAVSHDLRTPLAAAKAAVSCLRSGDIELTAEDHDELLATADESLDLLTRLAASLLDVSRLQAGALPVSPGPPASGRSSPAAWTTSAPRPGRSRSASRPHCPRCWPIRRSWNGSSPTWSPTPCGTPPRGRRRS